MDHETYRETHGSISVSLTHMQPLTVLNSLLILESAEHSKKLKYSAAWQSSHIWFTLLVKPADSAMTKQTTTVIERFAIKSGF